MLSSNQLSKLLMGNLNNSKAFNIGRAEIGNLTNKRIQDLLSRLSTTGLSRSGIGGAAANEAYKTAGQSFANLASQEEERKSRIIDQLLGLYKFDKEYEQNQTDFWDVLGGGIGLLGGSVLGGVGGAAGSALSSLLLGKKKGSNNSLYIPSIEGL